LITFSLKKKRNEDVLNKRRPQHIMRRSKEEIPTLGKIVHEVMVKELICENGSANKYINRYKVMKLLRAYSKIKDKCQNYFKKLCLEIDF